MSGTSMDAIDACIVDFNETPPKLIATHHQPLTDECRQSILALCTPGDNEIDRMGILDRQLGECFANACLTLLKQNNLDKSQIEAIGSHGQAIRHRPNQDHAFTLQIGDPNTIAELTGITTVADFRRRDIACGGQGAPLAPAFHAEYLSHPDKTRIIVNIGGMANLTVITPGNKKTVIGYDTGPGNVLMDAWIHRCQNQRFDKDGAFAQSGKLDQALLTDLLSDAYFKQPPPKSTGREKFNLAWLENKLSGQKQADVQATLLALTAQSICNAVTTHVAGETEVLLCGGGANNSALVDTISQTLTGKATVAKTSDYGICTDYLEAMAFAWLAKQTLAGLSGNLPAVTGASKPTILGGIYPQK